MRKHLREVTDHAAGAGVVFFREEADIVTQRQQVLEELPCLFVSTEQDKIIGVPEAAGEKGAFPALEAIG